jgi:hypothetical protein
MRERAMRLAIAVVQTWGQAPWAKAALVWLLSLWIVSAVVLWIHVSYDLCQTLRERGLAPARDPAMAPRGLRRDSDV